MWGDQIADDQENVLSAGTIYQPQKVMDEVDKVYAGENYYIHILKKDGTLWAYGYNIHGHLGDGTMKTKLTPVYIMSGVSTIISGYGHTFAIKKDDSLWGWGFNPCGAIGNGSTENVLSPVKICNNAKSVISCSNSTFIVKNDNSLWVCGDNYFGQLGDGTKNDILYPTKIMDGVKSVSCGISSSFFLKTDGTLWGCGNNWHRMFEDAEEHLSPVKVEEDIFMVSSESSYILYAKTDGSLWGCGDNSWGRIGCGNNNTYINHPQKVMEGLLKRSSKELSIPNSGFATFYSSRSAYTLPNGLSAQVVTGANNNKLTYKTIADGSVSGIVPKGTAVMLVSDTKQSGTFSLTPTESNTSYSGINLLHGSDESTTTTGDGYHYKLSYGPSGAQWSEVFGWYWGAQEGAPFQIDGRKAWLVVPKSYGTRSLGFTIDGDAADVDINDSSQQIVDEFYDLQGRRVNNPTKKGLYIKNGKKVVK